MSSMSVFCLVEKSVCFELFFGTVGDIWGIFIVKFYFVVARCGAGFLVLLKFANNYKCPFCGSNHVVKNGARGKQQNQKFICRNCKKKLSNQNNMDIQVM